jgi:arylsulfatase A-like enzyme
MTKPGSIRDDLVSWVDLAPTFHALAGLKPAERYDGRVFLGDQQEPEPETVFFARDRMDSSHDKVRGTADRRYLFLRNDRPDIPYAQFSDYMQISPVTAQARQRYVDGLMRFPEDLWMSPEKTKFELYDKFADPHCVHNLSERSDHQDTVQRMLKLVDDWCKRVDDKGEIPEQQLIDAGVIDDQIDEYNQRLVHKLEEPYRAGGLYDVHRDPTRV